MDVQTIRRYQRCLEISKELNLEITFQGKYFSIESLGVFENVQSLYDYLTGYSAGFSKRRGLEAVGNME